MLSFLYTTIMAIVIGFGTACLTVFALIFALWYIEGKNER